MTNKLDKDFAVFHIDTGKDWRGGQQQAFYLHKALSKQGVKSFMLCKKNSPMTEKCKTERLPCMNISLLSELDFYSVVKIAFLIRKLKINVLHLHTAHALTIGLLTKIICPHLKLIAVRRVNNAINKNAISFFKYNNSLLDKLVCISQNILNVAISNGISKDKLKLIYSGIDINRFNHNHDSNNVLKAKYNIPENYLVIGTIAALVGVKDYPTLLQSAKIILDKKPNIVFLAAGEGHSHNDLITLHSSLNLGNNFIFIGFESNIKSFLHSIDIFVLSSKNEGLGTSVLDAMSAGKAIVACNS